MAASAWLSSSSRCTAARRAVPSVSRRQGHRTLPAPCPAYMRDQSALQPGRWYLSKSTSCMLWTAEDKPELLCLRHWAHNHGPLSSTTARSRCKSSGFLRCVEPMNDCEETCRIEGNDILLDIQKLYHPTHGTAVPEINPQCAPRFNNAHFPLGSGHLDTLLLGPRRLAPYRESLKSVIVSHALASPGAFTHFDSTYPGQGA